MSELKKRAASSDGAAQVKKPKFEKKSIPKKNGEHENKKKDNPFQKTGMNSTSGQKTCIFRERIFLMSIYSLVYFIR